MKKWVLFEKHLTYTLILMGLYIVQATPGMLEVLGNKPLLVLPAVVCIAMHEGNFLGGIYGLVGGVFCDLSAFTYFGFNALLFLLIGVGVGLLVEYLMHNNSLNALQLTLWAMLIKSVVEYFFMYGIWGYDGARLIYLHKLIPVTIYSLLFVPLFYKMLLKLSGRYARKLQIR
mgnify:CR=1 FL=1